MDVVTIGPPILGSLQSGIGSSILQLTNLKENDSTRTDLISRYNVLNGEITTVLNVIQNPPSTGAPQYDATSFPLKLKSLTLSINELDRDKLKYLEKFTRTNEVSPTSILADTWVEIKNNIIFITTCLGMFFGSIVASNWSLVNSTVPPTMMYILFYAFYGSLLFPIPILYGLVFPPMWRAPLIPIFKMDENAPTWINYPGINLFTYVPPGPTDLAVGKGLLQIMCGVVTGFIGLSIYFKV